jgi:hypothetical protein
MQAPLESTSRDSKNDFYIQTKPGVDKILIFGKSGAYLGRLKKVHTPDNVHVFNGNTTETEFTACLLGGEGRTSYSFNDLFSQPLSMELIERLRESSETSETSETSKIWNNTIIINTPKELNVQFVTVDFPRIWQTFWSIPPTVFLYKFNKDKVTIEGTRQPSDFFKLGIDPAGDNFIASLELRSPSKEYLESISRLELQKMFEFKIVVKCYPRLHKQKFIRRPPKTEGEAWELEQV